MASDSLPGLSCQGSINFSRRVEGFRWKYSKSHIYKCRPLPLTFEIPHLIINKWLFICYQNFKVLTKQKLLMLLFLCTYQKCLGQWWWLPGALMTEWSHHKGVNKWFLSVVVSLLVLQSSAVEHDEWKSQPAGMGHSFNPKTWKSLWFGGHPVLHGASEESQSYKVKHFLKISK